MRNTIILMSLIWFVITLPLPWLITGDVGQDQLVIILPIIGFDLNPFCSTWYCMDIKARVNNLTNF